MHYVTITEGAANRLTLQGAAFLMENNRDGRRSGD
jgi:hypothetical protein